MSASLPESLVTTAELLYHRARSIRAVQGTEINEFTRALAALEAIAVRIDTPLAIVGGLAAIHYRANVTTLDIDVVVPRDRLDAFLAAGEEQNVVLRKRSDLGWHLLTFEDPQQPVDIEVISEGGKTPRDPEDAPPVPSPQELGVQSGLGYASYGGWVRMKLVAGRDKDRYHLIESLKQASAEQVAEAVHAVRSLDARYLAELNRLLKAAQDENPENW